jgi:hypothetical protein
MVGNDACDEYVGVLITSLDCLCAAQSGILASHEVLHDRPARIAQEAAWLTRVVGKATIKGPVLVTLLVPRIASGSLHVANGQGHFPVIGVMPKREPLPRSLRWEGRKLLNSRAQLGACEMDG